jgi:acetyltransferase-like isoleucine patch superfamily enzyme
VEVDMRAATIRGACSVVELAIKGESMAVGMRAATIKEACGVAELAIKGEYCGRH